MILGYVCPYHLKMNHTELTIDDTTVVSHLHMHMRDKQVGRLLVISKWVGNS